MIDRDEADDKIVAVLKGDAAYGHIREMADLPAALVDRLQHYFLTYKRPPGTARRGRRSRSPTSTTAPRPAR